MIKRVSMVAGIAAVVMALVGAFGATPTFAAAHPGAIKPASCQSSSVAVVLYLARGGSVSFSCSGNHEVDAVGTNIYAGGWSGFVTTSTSGFTFCDGETLWLFNEFVTNVYLAQDKISDCP